ncbi:MAG: penicillin-binding protein 2 [Bacteroidales bacterium]|nr:penicillin-binding protein 2 [Bacteroidales bacterium]
MNPIFERRKRIIILAMCILASLYLLKLFGLQVVDKKYKEAAERNAIREITITPPRGLIYDRNDSLLVYNEAAYDLMVIPKDVREFDTTDLCNTLDITKEELIKRLEKARNYSPLLPSIIEQQMKKEDYGYLQEKMHKFPGFFVQNRILRSYPVPIAAHILGYIGEVTEEQLTNDSYYQMGDYIGISGIEKSYEEELRGVKGKHMVLVDVNNREQGSYKNGAEDVEAIPGKNLWSTLDMGLQKYGEWLMEGKKGSIVAIEPATGEVLCIVSSPSYDPNLLVGKNRSKNYAALNADMNNTPLFNRALKACYPPGSTFKLANGLIAQQERVIVPSTYYSCGGGYTFGSHRLKCHSHAGSDLIDAVRCSCNAYFCHAFYNTVSNRRYRTIQEGYQVWKDHINQLGFGQKFNTDLPYESKGIIPSVEFFNTRYNGHWNGNSIISMAIGQGEVGATPMQMANLLAIIANRGYYYKPHVVRAIGTKDTPNTRYAQKIDAGIEQKYFTPIIEGMRLVVTSGTGRQAQVPGIEIAGKTGTAQNPHGEDHSVFACFAPVDHPQITVFVLVENGSWGGVLAARIASLITEYYFNREIKQTEKEKQVRDHKIYYRNNAR